MEEAGLIRGYRASSTASSCAAPERAREVTPPGRTAAELVARFETGVKRALLAPAVDTGQADYVLTC